MEIVFSINAVIFFMLFLVWSGKNGFNLFVKVVMFGLSLPNVFYAAKSFGVLIVI